MAINQDGFGTDRPHGSAWDIGAHEYTPENPPAIFTFNPSDHVTASNPVGTYFTETGLSVGTIDTSEIAEELSPAGAKVWRLSDAERGNRFFTFLDVPNYTQDSNMLILWRPNSTAGNAHVLPMSRKDPVAASGYVGGVASDENVAIRRWAAGAQTLLDGPDPHSIDTIEDEWIFTELDTQIETLRTRSWKYGEAIPDFQIVTSDPTYSSGGTALQLWLDGIAGTGIGVDIAWISAGVEGYNATYPEPDVILTGVASMAAANSEPGTCFAEQRIIVLLPRTYNYNPSDAIKDPLTLNKFSVRSDGISASSIIEIENPVGEKVWRVSGDGNQVVMFDDVPDYSETVETLVIYNSASGNYVVPVVRLNASGPVSGYAAGPTDGLGYNALEKWVDGSFEVVEDPLSEAHGLLFGLDWPCIRTQISGTTVSVKTWVYGEDEPEDWQATVEDSDITEGGAGLRLLFGSYSRLDIAWFSAGIEGASAPMPGETGEEMAKMSVIAAQAAGFYSFQGQIAWEGSDIISIPQGMVNIGGNGNNGYMIVADAEFDPFDENNSDGSFVTAGEGDDFYIFACIEDGTAIAKLIVSINSTYPDGYDDTNSRKVGGFHYGRVRQKVDRFDKGAQPTVRMVDQSVWDLGHRPKCDPTGMFEVVPGLLWADIYHNSILVSSWPSTTSQSVFGAAPITDADYSLSDLTIIAKNNSKRVPTVSEWTLIADGAPEGENNNTYAYTASANAGPTVTGSISKATSCPCARDTTGNLWEITSAIFDVGDYGGDTISRQTNDDVLLDQGQDEGEARGGVTHYTLSQAVCGGGFDSATRAGALAIHLGNPAFSMLGNVGLRCVCEAK